MTKPQSSRGDITRKKIIDTAERLMAEKGVDAVSMNEIVKASGQNNASALNYHFGNKTGLLQAVFDKHTPAIEERRQKLINELSAEPSLLNIVEALVLPLMEELDVDDGGKNYLKIIASLQNHSVGPRAESDQRPNPPLEALSIMLLQHCKGLTHIEFEMRAETVRNILLHNLAAYCRRLEANPECDFEYRPAFVSNLRRSISAVFSLPSED
ncbi:MAG: helix-turn-helix domain-containing protein [Pseudomonadales bacterium]